VAIVATHPIQYHVPWFCGLARRPEVEPKVYFALLPDAQQQGTGFGTGFQWDIPMLEGYAWERLPNDRPEPSLAGFFGSSTRAIHAVLERDRPDVLLLTGWNALPLLQALRAGLRLGIPRVVRGESNALRRRPPGIGLVHRALLRRYDAFLAIGKANRDFYLANGVPAARLFDCPYFVDNRRFAEAAQTLRASRGELRRGWNIAESAPCILFAGKLQPKKRIFDVLGAMRILKAAGAAPHLLVAGSGEELEAAREYARREALAASFAGFLNQSEMPRAYAAADCLVLPSDHGETWGLVVNEAMACGVPAIVSDRVGCAPDLVLDGQTGATFPFGDREALAARIGRLVRDRDELARMGARAREHVARYSVERAVEGTIAAVRSAARAA
jgi:glycosyltransferase involved in cell wall biosynthesis